jgi:hypothetical protein
MSGKVRFESFERRTLVVVFSLVFIIDMALGSTIRAALGVYLSA